MFEKLADVVVEELDAQATADYLAAAHRELVRLEAAVMAAVVHYADLHNGDTVPPAGGAGGQGRLPGLERAVRRGGDGTPQVAEFAHVEVAALQGLHPAAGAAMVADGQDLVHRLPRLWARLRAGQVRVWIARKIAAWTRGLSLEEARWLDAQITPYAASLPFGRLEALARAKIIEADPVAAEARRQATAAARFVRTGRSDEHGLKTLIIRANAGDVTWFVAMCDRIAHIWHAQGEPGSMDELRSRAVGLLAHPARALHLLLDFENALLPTTPPPGTTDPGADPGAADPGADPGAADPGADGGADPKDPDHPGGPNDPGDLEYPDGPRPGPGGNVPPWDTDPPEDPAHHPDARDLLGEDDLHPALNDAHDPPVDPSTANGPPGDGAAAAGAKPGEGCWYCHAGRPRHPTGTTGGTTGLTLAAHPTVAKAARLLPPVTLYVHIDATTLTHPDHDGVARIEGCGPVTATALKDLLGHTQVRVQPVLDLADQTPVDGYEIPRTMAEALTLLCPTETFPWGTRPSRAADKDHTTAYRSRDRGGPPGQTHLGNLGPLDRFLHRVKTFSRWAVRQPAPAPTCGAAPTAATTSPTSTAPTPCQPRSPNPPGTPPHALAARNPGASNGAKKSAGKRTSRRTPGCAAAMGTRHNGAVHARVIVLAGPSGSGKTRLAHRLGLPVLNLDDFYKDGSDPSLPRLDMGVVDWDDPTSWLHDEAVDAVEALCRDGDADVPLYEIARDGRTGHRWLSLGGSRYFVAEGIFAQEIVQECAARGILVDALCVRHHPLVTFWRRLTRDLRERRKPPHVLVRRGLLLLRAEPAVVAHAVERGCTAMTPKQAFRHVRRLTGATTAA